MRHLVFTVEVTELTDGWAAQVDAGDNGVGIVKAPGLKETLEGAVPFMHAVVEPDPLEALFREPSAQDGPAQGGDGGD